MNQVVALWLFLLPAASPAAAGSAGRASPVASPVGHVGLYVLGDAVELTAGEYLRELDGIDLFCPSGVREAVKALRAKRSHSALIENVKSFSPRIAILTASQATALAKSLDQLVSEKTDLLRTEAIQLRRVDLHGDPGFVIGRLCDDDFYARNGLRRGDVILEVAGSSVANGESIAGAFSALSSSSTPRVIELVRSGERMSLVPSTPDGDSFISALATMISRIHRDEEKLMRDKNTSPRASTNIPSGTANPSGKQAQPDDGRPSSVEQSTATSSR